MPHHHELCDETIYGQEGVMTFNGNGKPEKIAAGETLFITRGHCMDSTI